MRLGILGFSALAACGASQTAPSAHDSGSTVGDATAAVAMEEGGSEASAPNDAAPGPTPGTVILDLNDGGVWPLPLHACSQSPTGFTQSPPPPQGPSLSPCPGAGVSGVQITAVDGGSIAPGASAILSVLVVNAGAQIGYPCLGIFTDNPDVSFAYGSPVLYALGSSVTFSTQVTFGAAIAPGTHVHFAAWVGGDGGNSADGSVLQCASGLLEWEVVI
jgi:hypothetical protein